MSKTFEEINADGFVEEHVIGDTTYLRITEEGEQTLKFFSSSLSQEIKEQVREFLRENSQSIRNDNDVTGEYFRSTYGGFTARLTVREEANPAVQVIRNWKEMSPEIYAYLIRSLWKTN